MSRNASTSRTVPAVLPEQLQRHLHTARQLVEKDADHDTDVRSTGIDALDRLLAGGLPHGQLVELIGRSSSGRFSIALAVLAATTARGDTAALVDLGDALDPQCAALAGVMLERLLWIRPTHLKSALIAAEAVLGTGFPLVVLDLGLPPVPGGRGVETAWMRLSRAADAQRNTLLVTAPYRASGTAASVVLRTAGARANWSNGHASPRLLSTAHTRVELLKRRGHVHGAIESLELLSTEGLRSRAPTELPTLPPGALEAEPPLARTG
jgi:hypothetical protein